MKEVRGGRKMKIYYMTDLMKIANRIVRNPRYLFEKQADGTLKTFCNIAAWDFAESIGCGKFFSNKLRRPMLVEEIYVLVHALGGSWRKISDIEAITLATEGNFVIAIQRGKPGIVDLEDHIVVVLPGTIFSKKWNKKVPLCLNIGKENFIRGINFAFKTEPEYFLWIKTKGGNGSDSSM